VPAQLESASAAAAFVTTHWSVVLTAQGRSAAADDALEKLCRSYWPPLYAFIRRQGYAREEAKDLTQDFFARLLERRRFDAVREEKGRLRSYLLVALKRFLSNARDRAGAIKRGNGQYLISLNDAIAQQHADPGLADTMTADQLYERRWAVAVLEQVLSRLADEYRDLGKPKLFEQLRRLLIDDADCPSQADIASDFGMSENAVKQAFHRFRERYRQVLHEEIAHTVAAPGDIEDELRHLIVILRT
jgi:RNA polymerase sigma factor (sigma-70 family)